MKKISAVILAFCLLLSAAGCGDRTGRGKTGEEEPEVEKAVNLTDGTGSGSVTGLELDDEFAEGYQRFAFELLRQLYAAEDKTENRMVSPLSLLVVIAMLENGAGGETLAQMEELTGIERDRLNAYLFTLLNQLRKSEGVVFSAADALWVWEGAADSLHKAFLGRCADYFQAGVYKGAFDETTLRQINAWCSEQTGGRIKEILTEIQPGALLYLLNAISFQGNWEEEYTEDDISEGSFFAADGTEETVTMLHSQEMIYLESEDFTGFVKYYENTRYGFVGLLPKSEGTVSEAVDKLTAEAWRELFENARRGVQVSVTMPEFESEYEILLNETLKRMGMTNAFGGADFSQMFAEGAALVNLGFVLQKTMIRVNRKGTEAAAVTIAAVLSSCTPMEEYYEVVLDRPYLYAIIDMRTETPIFLGSTVQIGK
ncbi:MAG: serpin family protein [Lachnospiraceae bacterium]|nr:serpin family protein [Lachnospiraceae bacterium]